MIKKRNMGAIVECFTYLFLVLVMIFGLSRIYGIVLATPDDVAYSNILSGVSTGEPSPYCWFIRYPLAVFLASMYVVFPEIEWYQIFLISCHILCYFLICSRGCELKKYKKFVYICAVSIIILLLCVEYTLHLEWTSTAGLLGATAIYRYFTIDERKSVGSQIIDYVICLLLLIVGFCLRYQVIMMYIPLAFICWLKKEFDIHHLDEEAKSIKYKEGFNIGFLFAAGIAVLAVMLIHFSAYSTSDWREYSEYTKDRSTLVDYYGYPDYDMHQEAYQTAGISYEMYMLMVNDYNYMLPFSEVENVDFSTIANLAKETSVQKTFYEKIEYIQKKLETLFCDDRFLISGMMVSLGIAYLFLRVGQKKKIEALCYASIVAWFFVMLIYLASKGRLPVRVGISLVYGLVAFVFGDLYNNVRNENEILEEIRIFNAGIKNNLAGIVLVIVLGGVILFNLFDIYVDNIKVVKYAKAKNQILEYCAQNSDAVYLRDFWSFSQRGNLFYGNVKTSNYITTGGWTFNSPIYEEILEVNEVDTILSSMQQEDKVYYLVSERYFEAVYNRLGAYINSIGERIAIYEYERFNTDTETVVVLEFVPY